MTKSRDNVLRLFLYSLFFFLSAHAFCYFNLTLRGNSLILNASKVDVSSISSGSFLMPYYFRLRGGISSPFFIGILSFIYLFAAVLLLCDLLSMQDSFSQMLLSGLIMLSPALLNINVESLFIADAICLSFSLCIAGIYLLFKKEKLFPVAFVLLTCAQGLYPGHYPVPFLTLLLVLFHLCECGETTFSKLQRFCLPLVPTLSGFAAIFGYLFMCHHTGYDANAVLTMHDAGGLFKSLFYPLLSLLQPVNAYPHLYVLVVLLLAGLGIYFLLSDALRHSRWLILIAALVCLLPGLPFWGDTPSPQFLFSFLFPPMLILVLIAHRSLSKVLLNGIRALFAVIFLGMIVFSNQAYFKINLDFESTLSLMTQVLSRIEEQTDFIPGSTPVAFIGTPSESPLLMNRQGFEHLDALKALSGKTSLTNKNQMTWYFWETLGYPVNCISDFEQEQLAQREDVKQIPVFPHPGSIRMMDDILVIHLSE
ncbi:MAG: glucosyltransferase domain-containing protein [Clostridia bacterium]|nr:glucosyltransferase domain-containing protein [Clostridia bacterium]